MALELGTRLILRSAADGRPLPPGDLKALIADWAEVPGVAAEDLSEATGRGGGSVTTRTATASDGRARWELIFRREDDSDPTVAWTLALTALFERDRTTMVARLRRDASDHRLRPLVGVAHPPAVIRDVLNAEAVDCFDGAVRIEPRYRRLAADDVRGFIELTLAATDRRLPVIGIAMARKHDEGRLDVSRLVRELAGFAHVVLIERQALPTLAREIGNLSVSRSGVRLWWPGLRLDDDSLSHPHVEGPFADPKAIADELRRIVLEVSRDRWREPTRLVEFARDLRADRDIAGRAAAERVANELVRLRTEAAEARVTRETSLEADAAVEAAAAVREKDLESMTADLEEVRVDLDRQRAAVSEAEEMWEEAHAKADRLESENRALKGRLDGALAQVAEFRTASGAPEETDEEIFRNEVIARWDERLTPDDHARYPLAEFLVMPGFVASIESATADRAKVVDTAMEVVCGLVKDVPGRERHPLRKTKKPNSGVRERKADSATAWRCYLQNKTASARRLHYWACPGGRIDLANVVIHDDATIPE